MLTTTSNVAVIGGGLSGLAVAYHAAIRGCSVDIYDPSEPGSGGASPLASLMHPHSPRGKFIWNGLQGIQASLELMDFAQMHSEENASVFHIKGRAIKRPCLTDQHVTMFSKAALDYPDHVTYDDMTDSRNSYRGIATFTTSYVINTPVYLKSLYHGLHVKHSVEWIMSTISKTDIEDIRRRYSHVIICAGSTIQSIWEEELPTLTFVRGQNVKFEADSSICSLDNALICGQYIVPIGGNRVIGGATHEYNTNHLHNPPNLQFALEELMAPLTEIFPQISRYKPVDVKAGIRVSSPRTNLGKLPMIRQHPHFENVCMLTGFGSHGLVHHSIVAKLLIQSLQQAGGLQNLPLELKL
jgi:glycine oxidase